MFLSFLCFTLIGASALAFKNYLTALISSSFGTFISWSSIFLKIKMQKKYNSKMYFEKPKTEIIYVFSG